MSIILRVFINLFYVNILLSLMTDKSKKFLVFLRYYFYSFYSLFSILLSTYFYWSKFEPDLSIDIYSALFFAFTIFVYVILDIYYKKKYKYNYKALSLFFEQIVLLSIFWIVFSQNLIIMSSSLFLLSLLLYLSNVQKKDSYIYFVIDFFSYVVFFGAFIAIVYHNYGTFSLVEIKNMDYSMGIFSSYLAILLLLLAFAKYTILPLHGSFITKVSESNKYEIFYHIIIFFLDIYLLYVTLFSVFNKSLIYNLFVINKFNIILFVISSFGLFYALKAYFSEVIVAKLSYSSLSQLSYMVGSLFIMTKISVLATFLHLFFHGIAKLGLLIVHDFVKNDLKIVSGKKMGFIVSKFKGLFIAYGIFGFSIAGFPPLIGFFGKYYMIHEAVISQNYIYGFVVFLGILINIAYIYPTVKHLFAANNSRKLFSFKTVSNISNIVIMLFLCIIIISTIIASKYLLL